MLILNSNLARRLTAFSAFLTGIALCLIPLQATAQDYADDRLFLRLQPSTVCSSVDCWPDLLGLLTTARAETRRILPATAPGVDAAVPTPQRPQPGQNTHGGPSTGPVSPPRAASNTSLPPDTPANRLHRTWIVSFDPDAISVEALIEDLQALDEVEWALVDPLGQGGAVPPDDPGWILQWYLEQNSDVDLDGLLLWGITEGRDDVVVAVLDSGVDSQHPDFDGRIVSPVDIAYSDGDPDDAVGHGTNLAGIAVGATDNGAAGAGLCPRCLLMPVKVLDDTNFGFYSWWVDGIMHALINGADVINMSLGGQTQNEALEDAVAYAESQGVPVFAAMMNADARATFYPAAYAPTIAIGATDQSDLRASPFAWGGGSNWGPHIDLSAPGQLITAAKPGGGHEPWSGTSQATAVVSGVAALMLTLDGELTPAEIRQILIQTAIDQVGRPDEDMQGWDEYHGAGRLNALAALTLAGQLEDTDGDGYPDVIDCVEGGANANPEQAFGCEPPEMDPDPDGDMSADMTTGDDVDSTEDVSADLLDPPPDGGSGSGGGSGGMCSVSQYPIPSGWPAWMLLAVAMLGWIVGLNKRVAV